MKDQFLTCRLTVIAFYSSSIFVDAGYSARQALYASLGFGAVNFLFAFPALFTIDTCQPNHSFSYPCKLIIFFKPSWSSQLAPLYISTDGLDPPRCWFLLFNSHISWNYANWTHRILYLPLRSFLLSRRRTCTIHVLCGGVPTRSAGTRNGLGRFHMSVLGCCALYYVPPFASSSYPHWWYAFYSITFL